MHPIYALVDCNQFYVSCERSFAPHLETKPVGILSNNDGCIVALSPELKKLGVKRGTPGFKIKEIVKNQKVYLFSSNYELYGDMSARVMNILSSIVEEIEIYSIDEAFMLFDSSRDISELLQSTTEIREYIKKATGIPVSIGLGRTKTLAKVANHLAKKSLSGIMELLNDETINEVLKYTKIEDIWGIGRQYTKRLNRFGIYTALDFVKAPSYLIRKEMSVMGERTQSELKGIPCNELIYSPPATKSIVFSRSFGKPVATLEELLESVSTYTSSAIKNLREKGLVAKNIHIFITTNPFKNTKQYANFAQSSLPDYSAYTPDFIKIACDLLKKIYKKNYLYKKTGVMLTDIIKQDKIHPNLFSQSYGTDKRHLVMKAIDKINNKYGKEKIYFASNGVENSWKMKREMNSPRYTTRWEELMKVK